jgi:hypothetical protein
MMGEGHRGLISRRTAMQLWVASSASLTLLAVSGTLPSGTTSAAPAEQSAGPAPVQIPSATPSTGTGPATRPSSSSAPSAAVPSPVAATPSCVLTREQTEGPYYIDVALIRSDITEGKEGLPLRLDLTVLNATSCQPIPNATVEIWHCDAAGDYSGFSGSLPSNLGEPPGSASGSPPPVRPGPGEGSPPGGDPPSGGPPGDSEPMRNTPTNDMVFLRGGQTSDASGRVTFQTI